MYLRRSSAQKAVVPPDSPDEQGKLAEERVMQRLAEERAMHRLANAQKEKFELRQSLVDRGVYRGTTKSGWAITTVVPEEVAASMNKWGKTGITEVSTTVPATLESAKRNFQVQSARTLGKDFKHRAWSSSFGVQEPEISENSRHQSALNTYRPLSSLPPNRQLLQSANPPQNFQVSHGIPSTARSTQEHTVATSPSVPNLPAHPSMRLQGKKSKSSKKQLQPRPPPTPSFLLTAPDSENLAASLPPHPLIQEALKPDRTAEQERQRLENLKNSTIKVRENKGNYFNKIKHYSKIYNPKEKSSLIFGQQEHSPVQTRDQVPEQKNIRLTTVNMRDYEKSIQQRLETFSVFAFSGGGVDKASLAKELDNIGRGVSFGRPMGITDLWSKDFHSEVMNKAEHGRFRLRIQRYLHVLHRQGKGNSSISRLMLDSKEAEANNAAGAN